MNKIHKLLILPLAIAFMAFGSISQANAQTVYVNPTLAIQLATSGLTSPLVANSSSATMARLLIDTTGATEAVRVSSLPFNLVLGSGALASSLENCRVYNEANPTVAISSATSLSGGLNAVALNSPLILNAGTLNTLALRCDINSSIVAGGTYTFTMNTADFSATGVTSGLPATVTVRGAVVVIPPAVITPGFPATGATNDAAQNILVMLGSISLAAVGFHYARKQSLKA
ncbi:MAG: hypothetical protein WD874_00465 [Parcubacteria group bacterium]